MAESRGSLIAKSVQKHAGRAKEKILQNLGKVDRTADDIFDEHLQNFTRQQNAANRLQKEFNNYIRCIRAVQAASKTFLEAVGEVYESQWGGHDLVFLQTQSVDMLYQDFSHKLGDQVLIPLNTYQGQFPEMRKKIDKRGRKLVDYDGQRHNFQALQMSMAKKRDDGKLGKGRELLEEAKRTYEVLNSELHDELPALHESRILFLVTNLQTLFNAESLFHAETGKVRFQKSGSGCDSHLYLRYKRKSHPLPDIKSKSGSVFSELEAIVDKLATDSQRGSYSIKKTNGASLPRKLPAEFNMNNISPQKNSPINMPSSENTPSTPTNSSSTTISPKTPREDNITNSPSLKLQNNTPDNIGNSVGANSEVKSPVTPQPRASSVVNGNTDFNVKKSPEIDTVKSIDKLATSDVIVVNNTAASQLEESVSNNNMADTSVMDKDKMDVDDDDDKIKEKTSSLEKVDGSTSSKVATNVKVQELYDIPTGASTDNLPPGVLYRVKATYKYQREDVDELSFDVGETIQVIAYDDPEEQEEGWLMGMKEDSGERGMFPANFTKPL